MIRNPPSFRSQLSGAALPLIALGAALNLGVGQLIAILKLPVYLDTVGTVLVSCAVGPWAGLMSGVAAAIVGGIFINPYLPYYLPTVACVAFFSSFCATRGWFNRWPTLVLAGIAQGILAAAVSAPITTFLFGGVTMAGSTFIVAYLRATGETLLRSVFLAGLAADPVDKTVTFALARLLIDRVPASLAAHYPGLTRFADHRRPGK